MANTISITAKSGIETSAVASGVKTANYVEFDFLHQIVRAWLTADRTQLVGEWDLASLGTSITITVTSIGTATATYAVAAT